MKDMGKVKGFSTKTDAFGAANDKYGMKTHTKATVLNIRKRGKKHEQETSNKHC